MLFAGTPLYRSVHGGVEYLADDCTLDYHLYFPGTGGGPVPRTGKGSMA